MVFIRPSEPLARGLRFALGLACAVSWPTGASANGAFADSQAILLPRGEPHRILASSDLAGLLVSDDDGATWSWICESAIGHFAGLFQLGPAPTETLFAITQLGLARSGDRGCSWDRIGDVAQRAGDVFADPNDPERVFLVAQLVTDSDDPVRPDVVALSADGGRTFGPALYSTKSASITGVEVARSDPQRIYLTLSGLEVQHPYIARSSDGGASWSEVDLYNQLGRRPLVLRILAVNAVDPDTVYVRVSNGAQDALAITRDGGSTLQVAQSLDRRMTAFLQRSDGAIIVASADAKSFISRDGGSSFEPWSDAFHIQALAERAGTLYATASSRDDGFVFASSDDLGSHWRPMLTLDQLRGPAACGSVSSDCATSWSQLAPSLGALAGQPRSISAGAAAGQPSAPERVASGGCGVAGSQHSGVGAPWILLLGWVALGGRRSRWMTREDTHDTTLWN